MTASDPVRILIISYSTFLRSPRPLKQVRYLYEKYEVVTAGFGSQPVEGVRHIELPELPAHFPGVVGRLLYFVLLGLHSYRLLWRISARDHAAYRMLKNEKWDIVIAHDVRTITLANRLHARRGVVVDLHEYAPRQNEHSPAWRFLIAPYFRWLCRNEVTKAATAVTVSQGIVDEYRREYGIESHLVVNATPYQDLEPVAVSSPIKLVHSGAAAPARKIEVLIEAVRETQADVTLDLYLIDDGTEYFASLRQLASQVERVRLRDAVPYTELISVLNSYDVGISILAPINFNHLWALPNKLFDYVQARLGVIVGPSPEMARIVREHSIGAVLPDFTASSLARVLEATSAHDVAEWKAASSRDARALSSEAQMYVWEDLIQDLVRSA